MISVVIPVYNEGKSISGNIREIRRILDVNNIPHEFVLVDDGSKDNTWDQLTLLSKEMSLITAVRLSRNFGKEAAICAGMMKASGNAVVLMDSDLQHPPDAIPEMVRLWKEEKYQVVDGVKESRGKESVLHAFCAGIFYRMLKKVSGMDLTNASDFKLLDKEVLQAWKRMPEKETFFRGMSYWVGFRRTTLRYLTGSRTEGKSRWHFFSLVKLALNAITAFSAVPLQIVTFLGFVFLFGSLILGIHTVYMWFSGNAVSGFTTVILLILITGSTLMISLGIIGIYLSRIYEEVKRRPRYIISKIIKS